MPNLVNPKSSWACLPPGGGEGVWSASVSIQAALCEAKFFGSSTISSPLQVHAIAKVSAKRAPNIGEHSDELLRQLGFSAPEIDGLRASGAIPKAMEHAV
jgi:hypothetical protein